jgi:hypothetical protein
LIDHDSPVLTAVALEIGLAVAVQIEPSGYDSPRDSPFPDRCANDSSLPRDFLWKADIDRQKFGHCALRSRRGRLHE